MSKIRCPICGEKSKIKYYQTVSEEKFICQVCKEEFSFKDVFYGGMININDAFKELKDAWHRLFLEVVFALKLDKIAEWINGKIKRK